jgi:hypothetical protein
MSKGFTVARCSVISIPSLTLALFLLAADLSSVCHAQTPIQTHPFRDEFQNRSHIASSSNAAIDTVAGVITLVAIPFPRSTTASDSVALSGIDTTFKAPTDLNNLNPVEVKDIDPRPGEDDVYLVTEAASDKVFLYNARFGISVSSNLLSNVTPFTLVDPVDAFPFLEGNVLKVLITDSRGRVFKINTINLNVEWPPNPSALPYSNPSDAVFLPDRQEVLICETGRDQLIAVSVVTDTIRWQFDGGADQFNMPVDVDVDPRDPNVYLVTDRDNHRVVLVRRTDPNGGQIISQFGRKGQPGADSTSLNFPMDADFVLDAVDPGRNGNLLIADTGNNRLIEVNPNTGKIVYTFARPLAGLIDADRLPNEQTLIAYQVALTKILPKRLAYQSNVLKPEYILKPPFDFGRKVDFDSLRWTDKPQDGTSIRLQLRAFDNLGEIADDNNPPWSGPTGPNDFYVDKVTQINPALDGKQYIQFRVFLTTNSRLLTPVLRTVTVEAHYFPSTPLSGMIASTPITDSTNIIITAWRSLEFTTASPAVGTSITVDILDSLGTTVLAGPFPSSVQPRNSFDIDPTRVPALKNKQALRLRATLRTENSAITPIFTSWALEWNFVRLGPSRAAFTNSILSRSKNRLNGVVQDSAYISVVDPNALPLLDSVLVNIQSVKAKDAENIFLKINPITRAIFSARLPATLIQATASGSPGNRRLEVYDRDTLRVDYTDPLDASDKSRNTALVIRRTRGNIFTENSNGTPIDTISIGGSLYVRVTGEADQNDSPAAPDSIYVLMFNPQTLDSDSLKLHEIDNNSGNFRNRAGFRVVKEGTQVGNGQLSVVGGEIITARYKDADVLDELPIEKSVHVLPIQVTEWHSRRAYEFIIAPNLIAPTAISN